jgi:hypothetical protein
VRLHAVFAFFAFTCGTRSTFAPAASTGTTGTTDGRSTAGNVNDDLRRRATGTFSTAFAAALATRTARTALATGTAWSTRTAWATFSLRAASFLKDLFYLLGWDSILFEIFVGHFIEFPVDTLHYGHTFLLGGYLNWFRSGVAPKFYDFATILLWLLWSALRRRRMYGLILADITACCHSIFVCSDLTGERIASSTASPPKTPVGQNPRLPNCSAACV